MFKDLSSYPEYEGSVFGLYKSAFYANYPKCEFNKIHVIEHTAELLVDALMPTLVGATSLKKLMTGRKEIQMFSKYSMLIVLAFTVMTSVQAASLNNNKYEYATVFIPNRGGDFTYSTVSDNIFHKQRVSIQQLNILSDELSVAVPLGQASELEKLGSMLEQAGYKEVSHQIVYAGFEKVITENELWQDVVHNKRFAQRNSRSMNNVTVGLGIDGSINRTASVNPSYISRHEQDHKTGQRIHLKKGAAAGHAFVFRRLSPIE